MSAFHRTVVGLALLLGFALYEPIPFDIVDYYFVWRTTNIIKAAGLWNRLTGRAVWEFDPINTFQTHAPPDADVAVKDLDIDGVPVRFYRPARPLRRDALVVWIHGGGFAWGSVKGTDRLVLGMAKRSGLNFASIEYRRSPQHPFPAPHDDCLTAVKGMLQRAQELGFVPGKMVLMGASAGGNLAAYLTQALRPTEGEEHPVKLQVLVYPVLQIYDTQTPSWQLPYSPLLTHKQVLTFGSLLVTGTDTFDYHNFCAIRDETLRRRYLSYTDPGLVPEGLPPAVRKPRDVDVTPDSVTDRAIAPFIHFCKDPRLSPLVVEDLSRLPKALLQACEYDVLRDDAVFYAKRLVDAGVEAEVQIPPKTYHGIFTNLKSEVGRKMADDALDFIHQNL